MENPLLLNNQNNLQKLFYQNILNTVIYLVLLDK